MDLIGDVGAGVQAAETPFRKLGHAFANLMTGQTTQAGQQPAGATPAPDDPWMAWSKYVGEQAAKAQQAEAPIVEASRQAALSKAKSEAALGQAVEDYQNAKTPQERQRLADNIAVLKTGRPLEKPIDYTKLLQMGMWMNPSTGAIEPAPEVLWPPELVTKREQQRDRDRYIQAQTDLAQARTAFEKSRSDPNSLQYQTALERLKVSQENAATAANRLGLAQEQQEFKEQGPTTPTRSAGQAADSVLGTFPQIRSNLEDLKDKYGPVAGRWTNLSMKGGSVDPRIADTQYALDLVATGLARAHGTRAKAVIDRLRDPFNPKYTVEDIQASLNAAERLLKQYSAGAKWRGGGTKPAVGAPSAPAVANPDDPLDIGPPPSKP